MPLPRLVPVAALVLLVALSTSPSTAWGASADTSWPSLVTLSSPRTPAEFEDWTPLPPFPVANAIGALDETGRRALAYVLPILPVVQPHHRRLLALSLTGDSLWVDATTGAPGPLFQPASSMIADPPRRRLLLLGQGTLWAFDLAGTGGWTTVATAGSTPALGMGFSAVYDSASQRVLVFGGAGSGTPVSTTYALSLSGTPTWSTIAASGPPPGRRDHSAIIDPVRRRMIVHGGRDNTRAWDDFWAMSLDGPPTWTALAPVGTDMPFRRYGHAAIYDPFGDRMIVFSGVIAFPTQNDGLWELKLGTNPPQWNNMGVYGVSGTYPSQRVSPIAGLDFAGRQMVVAFGSLNSGGSTDAGTYALSLTGSLTWKLVAKQTHLFSRREAGVAYDPLHDQFLAYSGSIAAWGDDTWVQDIGARPAWRYLGTGPRPRMYATAIYDPRRARYVMYGGYANCGEGCWPGDVYTLDARSPAPAWVTVPGSFLTGRQYQTGAYDPIGDRLLIYGGSGLGGQRDQDLHAFSLATSTWSILPRTATGPTLLDGAASIVDVKRNRMLIYGGNHPVFGPSTDLWSYDLSGSGFTLLATSGTPPSGVAPSAVLDPLRDRMLVLAERAVRALDLATLTWGPVFTTGPVDGRIFYDPARDALLLFGDIPSYGSTATWRRALGGSPSLAPDCAGDVSWVAGSSVPVSYSLANPAGFDQPVDWSLTSERQWPGFPLSGSGTVAAGGGFLTISVPVPDTAAPGLNTLRLTATLRATPIVERCSNHIHDATTAVEFALISTDVSPHRVGLTWQLSEGGTATLERRTETSAWSALATLVTNAERRVTYEDADVSPGERLGYRLRIADAISPEAWVQVPAGAGFALRAVSPNPSTDALWARFELPEAGPARIEVLDVTGRRVRLRELWADAPGARAERVDGGRALAPGVYVMRLTFAGRSTTARAVVVR